MARKKKWIQTGVRRKGAFTAKARRAGMSVPAYAKKVLSRPRGKRGSASARTWHQAHAYRNMMNIRRRRRRR